MGFALTVSGVLMLTAGIVLTMVAVMITAKLKAERLLPMTNLQADESRKGGIKVRIIQVSYHQFILVLSSLLTSHSCS